MLTFLSKKKKKTFFTLNASSVKEKAVILADVPRKKNQKLVLVSATFTLLTAIKKRLLKMLRLIRLIRLMKMVRLMRMVKMIKMRKIWEQNLHKSHISNILLPFKNNLYQYYLTLKVKLLLFIQFSPKN